jgi:hypothetical protein
MTMNTGHLTDEELLLAADEELDSRQAENVQQHLLSCPECRARAKDLKASIAEFVHLHHALLNVQMPPIEGSRRQLKAQLSELANTSVRKRWWQIEQFALATVAILIVIGFVAGWQHRLAQQLPETAQLARDPSLPNPILTPGSYRSIRLQDVCRTQPYEQARVTSLSLKQQVLREYGMPGAAVSDHEIDFLVIPELGGTENIQNLWPEPYASTVWNARVKDELEERLHQMVCAQQVDLQTAQRDIATDWISAYKKYFHTDKPLPINSNS